MLNKLYVFHSATLRSVTIIDLALILALLALYSRAKGKVQ